MMVALPQTISPTIAAIDVAAVAKQRRAHVQRMTARSVASSCDRQSWYAFRWADEPRTFDATTCRANEFRDTAHGDMVQYLVDAGISVERITKDFRQIEFDLLDGHYWQRVHGIATGILQAPKTPHFVLVDVQPEAKFKQIVKHGVAITSPDHIAAMQLGMHALALTRAYYLVKNRNTEELHDERIHYDAAAATALLAKAERIRDANHVPARISEDPTFYTCRFCPSNATCHGQTALRNCRTCLHSAVGSAGAWHCARHDRVLSIDDQKAGCVNHLFLPSLVPGEQIDADQKAETVTYRMRDGSIWSDGYKPREMA